jgi:hypothetical protein
MAHSGVVNTPAWRGRRLRVVAGAAVCGLLLTLVLAGCGGESATSPYDCVSGGGCSNYVYLSQRNGDFTSAFIGVQTDVDVVPLACDSACQASSGAGVGPGTVMTYVSIFDASTHFIRMGYMTHGGRDAYFYDSLLPGGSYVSPTFPLGDTEIGPGYTDTYTSTGMRIEKPDCSVIAGLLGACGWFVNFHLRHAAAGGAVGDNTFKITPVGFDLSSFVPVTWSMGQYIYGHSGATADYGAITNNLIATTCVPAGIGSLECLLRYVRLTRDGAVIVQTRSGAPPPYANWLAKPSRSSTGGLLYVECCRPLHIDIGS